MIAGCAGRRHGARGPDVATKAWLDPLSGAGKLVYKTIATGNFQKMHKRSALKVPDLILGPLPVELINKLLGYELNPGEVVLTRGAQSHAARRHPEDYPVCLPHVAAIVTNPLYIGDDLRNHGKIELVGRVPAAGIVLLVAVNITRDNRGRYRVESFYPISETKVQNRRDKGHLKVAV